MPPRITNQGMPSPAAGRVRRRRLGQEKQDGGQAERSAENIGQGFVAAGEGGAA
mgnify:CR=1 FL=1